MVEVAGRAAAFQCQSPRFDPNLESCLSGVCMFYLGPHVFLPDVAIKKIKMHGVWSY